MKEILVTMAKGLWIGGTLTIPGLSGGAMAMLLGIYDRMVISLNSLFRKGDGTEKKRNFLFLLWAAVGGLAGFVLFSRLVGMLLEAFPLHVSFLFAGAVAGGIPAVISAAKIKRVNVSDLLFVIIGIGVVFLVGLIPEGLFSPENANGLAGFGIQLAGGFVVAFGLVLPGISMSQMLYVFGIYGVIIDCMSRLDFLPLIPFAIGGLAGTLATSFGVEKLLFRYPRQTYLAIFGFLLGSIPQMFENVSFGGHSVPSWLFFLLLFAVGGSVMTLLFLAESGRLKRK